ncbi:RHS repeat-associated core domain-containing protein, partial [Actinosynnema sp.]|uniref:RHS repeat-associated core domain-containing protein n=1 Tax=Actinosynnema sp. TaxID=1872144 RepID=UPI003F87C71E
MAAASPAAASAVCTPPGVTARQCFAHDFAGRMSAAYTVQTSTACSGTAATGAVGSGLAGAYNLSYAFNGTGNRTTETDRTALRAWTSAYPAAGSSVTASGEGPGIGGPHAPTTITSAPVTVNGATGTGPTLTFSYAYDAAGNMVRRPVDIDSTASHAHRHVQALAYNAEGRLDTLAVHDTTATSGTVQPATPTTGASSTLRGWAEFDYGPSGQRLLRVQDPGATSSVPAGASAQRETTLTIGDTELTVRPARTALPSGTTGAGETEVVARRSVAAGLATVVREAVTRNGALVEAPRLRVSGSDHNGTATVQIDARDVTQTPTPTTGTDPHRGGNGLAAPEVTYRFTDPYGDPLDTRPAGTTGTGNGALGGHLSGQPPAGSPGSLPGRSGLAPDNTTPGWVGETGFVGGTIDLLSGLTQIGYRAYDPQAGLFTATDPVVDTANHRQLAGTYGYGAAAPATWSDPTGLEPYPHHKPGVGFNDSNKTYPPYGGKTPSSKKPPPSPSPTSVDKGSGYSGPSHSAG